MTDIFRGPDFGPDPEVIPTTLDDLTTVDPATRFDLIADDLDVVLVGFDFAEYMNGALTLWVRNDETGAREVAAIWTELDVDGTTVTLFDNAALGDNLTVRVPGRVSLMAPFGARRATIDQLQAYARS